MAGPFGSKPLTGVVINQVTALACVWTHAQFLDDAANALGFRIAAGNVAGFRQSSRGSCFRARRPNLHLRALGGADRLSAARPLRRGCPSITLTKFKKS